MPSRVLAVPRSRARAWGSLPLLMGALFLAPGCAPEAEPLEEPLAQRVEQAAVTLPLRINAGGGAYTDLAGRVWEADRGFIAGSAATLSEPIAGTQDDPLYQSVREGNSFFYSLPLPAKGFYRVVLHFAYPYHSNTLDIRAEEQLFVGSLDLAKVAGQFTAYTVQLDVLVTDGRLDLGIMNDAGTAIISAIEVDRSPWWTELGHPKPSATASDPREVVLATDASNRLTAAWLENVPAGDDPNYFVPQLVVRRWTGSQWRALGDALGSTQAVFPSVSAPAMTLGANGAPLVAFLAEQGTPPVVFKWTGTEWRKLALPPLADPLESVQGIAIALAASGQPVVALATKKRFDYSYSDGWPYVHVLQWSGSAWTALGPPLEGLTFGEARNPSLAVDRYGRTVVAWDEYNKRSTYNERASVRVARYQSGQWVNLGSVLNHTPSNPYVVAEKPSLVVDPLDGSPAVAWIDEGNQPAGRRVFVARWSEGAGTWTPLTGEGLDGWDLYWSRAYWPRLTTGTDGRLVVAWTEYSQYQSGCMDFLRAWNGTTWSSFASNPHSVISGGCSGGTALALNSQNQPILMTARYEPSTSGRELHARQFVP